MHSFTSRKWPVIVLALVAWLTFSVQGVPAHADEPRGVAQAKLADLAARSTSLAHLDETPASFRLESGSGVSVEIGKDPRQPITLQSKTHGNRSLKVGLPSTTTAKKSQTRRTGHLQFVDQNETTTSVLPYEDGSVQILTTISAPSAPTEYAYALNLPRGARAETQENGSIFFVDANGDYIGAVAPAWAIDDSGKNVPTRYEVRGNSLVQIVEHSSASDVRYPVVADPWFGINLFSSIWRDWYNGDYRYNGNVSWWGATVMWGGGGVGGYAAGQYIMRTAGWAEWTSKYSAITNKATLKQQYDCHVLAGTIGLPFTGTYNLERFRANKSDWLNGVWSHRCNW